MSRIGIFQRREKKRIRFVVVINSYYY